MRILYYKLKIYNMRFNRIIKRLIDIKKKIFIYNKIIKILKNIRKKTFFYNKLYKKIRKIFKIKLIAYKNYKVNKNSNKIHNNNKIVLQKKYNKINLIIKIVKMIIMKIN